MTRGFYFVMFFTYFECKKSLGYRRLVDFGEVLKYRTTPNLSIVSTS